MNRKLSLAVVGFLLFFLLVSTVKASEGVVYVYGTVASAVNEKNYGPVYVQFTFEVSQTNSSLIVPLPKNMTCIALRSFLSEDFLQIGSNFNFSGQFIEDQPNADSPPIGYFLITSVFKNVTSQSGWMQTLIAFVNAVAGIGKLLITLIVQGFEAVLGVTVPDWTVAAIVVLLLIGTFIKWFKKLPFYVILVGIVIIVGMVTYMFAPWFGFHI